MTEKLNSNRQRSFRKINGSQQFIICAHLDPLLPLPIHFPPISTQHTTKTTQATMHYQTTRITVTFNGSPTAVHYWVDGNGHHFPGYATSLRQLRKQLYVAFGVPDLDLYCITNKRMHALTSDSQMRRAIHASGGDTLLLTAYEPNDQSQFENYSFPFRRPQLRVPVLQANTNIRREIQICRHYICLQRMRRLLFSAGLKEEAQVPRTRDALEN